MQRHQLAPDDLVALCFYVSPLDPVPDNTLETPPSASFQPDPMAVYLQPPWTWQPPPPQLIQAQILNSTQMVQAETFERRRSGFGTIPYYDELLKSNDLTFEQFHVLHPNAPHSTSWIDPQVPQSAVQPQLVYLSCCPQTVTLHEQPALQNIAVDSVRTEVQSSKASASEEASSKVAPVVEEEKPEVKAPATDEDQLGANPVEKEVPVIPTRSLDEETRKELAFEEYNAIMDSIEIEERHKEDYLLTELYKDDEMFLEYLDELCGESSFVRNVGSELNMKYWEFMLSSNADTFDLFAVENKSREEGNLQKTPPASDGGANVSPDEGPVTLAKSPKSDENVSSDDHEASERLFQEILDAVASILSDSMNEAATTKEDAEAQVYWVNTREPVTAPHPPPCQDVPTEGRDIIEWLLANIPQEQGTLDDAPGGSPLLPTHRLELIQATPDDYMTTFSTPFDESIYMGFHSPKQATPMDPDLSSEDLEALAEVWLKDSPEESPLHADSEEAVQPKLGHASPAPLCDLALRVFLNSEKPADEASFETARQESNSQDVLMVRSPVPCSGSDCNVANGDAAQNSKPEAREQEEEPNGERLVQAQASDEGVSICEQENVKRKDKKTVPMRWSQRLSSQICKLAGGDEVPKTIDKQEKMLDFGHGDNEENPLKHRAFEALESIGKTKNGRKKREAKESEHNEKTRFIQIPRAESLGDGALKSPNTRVKAKVEKCPAKRSRQKAVKEIEMEKTVGISGLKSEEKCQKISAKRRRQEAVEEVEKAVSKSSKKAKTKDPSGGDDKRQSGMEKGKASSKRSGTEGGKMATRQTSSTDKAGKTHSSKSITRTSRRRPEKQREFAVCKLKARGKRSSATGRKR